MKKGLLFVLFALAALQQAGAQVTFRPAVRAGVNFSYLTQGDERFHDGYYNQNGDFIEGHSYDAEFKSKTDFYVGFYGALRLTRYYTMQPEVNYSRQGTNYSFVDAGMERREVKLDLSYLSVGLINKFTFNEQFNIHFGPTLDFIVEKNVADIDTDSDVDMAFVGGFGYNFNKNFGIEARVKKGLIPVLDYWESNHSNVVFSVGATYVFDIK